MMYATDYASGWTGVVQAILVTVVIPVLAVLLARLKKQVDNNSQQLKVVSTKATTQDKTVADMVVDIHHAIVPNTKE